MSLQRLFNQMIWKPGTRVSLACLVFCWSSVLVTSAIAQEDPPPEVVLDESCLVNLLNYSVQVKPDGTWALPSIPVEPGYYRIRVTCTKNGETIGGMSDFFELLGDGPVDYGKITFNGVVPPPKLIVIGPTRPELTQEGEQLQMVTFGLLPTEEWVDLTTSAQGTFYSSSNSDIASVDQSGVVTAHKRGSALIQARNEGQLASFEVQVLIEDDDDKDGIPTPYEQIAGLDPYDPTDATTDQDLDLLTALVEYELGTNPFLTDTDGDELTDGAEYLTHGTNPLQGDSDTDGLIDGKEIFLATDALNPDTDADGILDGLEVSLGLNPKIATPSTQVKGKVVYPNGAPVVGAAVIIYEKMVTNTNEDGDYFFPKVPKISKAKVQSFARLVTDGEIAEAASAQLNAVVGGLTDLGTTTLKPLVEAVAGTVKSPSGKVVAGANVTLIAGGEVRSTTTNNSGVYLFKQVPPGFVILQSIDPKTGLRAQQTGTLVEESSLTVNIPLVPSGTILGKVKDVDGATFVGPEIPLTLSGPLSTSAVTDVFSEYRFGYLPLGVYTVEAVSPDGKRGRTVANLNSTNQVFKADVVYLGRGTVMGTVETITGQKVSGAQVTLFSQSVFGGTKTAITDGNGLFMIEDVFVGSYQLSAYDAVSGFGGFQSGNLKQDGDVNTHTITLTPSAALTGVVLEADGTTPVPGAKVQLSPSGKAATADNTGTYTFSGLPLGVYTVVATKPSNGDKGKTIANVDTADAVTNADVLLTGLGTVQVTVQDAAGAPAPNAKVTLTSTTSFGGNQTITADGNGLATFQNVLAGTFSVSATSASTLLGGSVSSSVLPGETTAVVVKLEPAGTIQGTVFYSDGVTPAANVKVKLSPVTREFSTGTDGKFVFEGNPVAKSPYLIKVYDAQGMLRAAKFNVSLSFNGQVATHNLIMEGSGKVQGIVTNASGVPVAGVNLTLTSNIEGAPARYATTGLSGQYVIGNVPMGTFSIKANKTSPILNGSASGAILFDGDIAEVNVTVIENQIPPPPPPPPGAAPGSATLVTLYDANNFSYPVKQTGAIADGTQSVFQGDNADARGATRLELVIGGQATTYIGQGATLELSGRQVSIAEQTIGGLSVSRKVYVPQWGYFTRQMDILENTTGQSISVKVNNNTTYRNRTQVLNGFTFTFGMGVTLTTNNDNLVQPTDTWMVLDDNVDEDAFLVNNNLPATAHVLQGPGGNVSLASAQQIPNYTAEGRTRLESSFGTIVIPPGERVIFLHFVTQQTTRAAAEASAKRLVQLPPEALWGLTADEMTDIVNFVIPADGMSNLEPLEPLDGKIDGDTLEADLTTAVGGAPVTFQSTNLLFGRTYSTISNADGEFKFHSSFNTAGSSLAVPRTQYKVVGTHPLAGVKSPEIFGEFFFPDDVSSNVTIAFLGTGIVTGVVSRPDNTVVSTGTVTATVSSMGNSVKVNIGPDGSYTIFGLKPGLATLVATMPVPNGTGLSGVTSATIVDGQITTANIVIEDAGTILGTVFQGSIATPNVTVKLTGQGNFSRTTKTDTGGAYVFIDTPQGEFTVTAWEPKTNIPVSETVEVTDSLPIEQNLQLTGLSVVAVTATFPGGVPAQGAPVQIQKTPVGNFFVGAGTTNALGKINVGDVPEGAFIVRVFHPSNPAIFVDQAGIANGHGAIQAISVIVPIDDPPTVTLTAPQNGLQVVEGTLLTFGATASDDIGIQRVEFLANGLVVATDYSAPYSAAVPAPKPQSGDSLLVLARAVDNGNQTTLSDGVVVSVLPDTTPPSVNITSPANGASFVEGKSFTISANASDNVGIAKVDILANDALVISDTSPPYSASFTIPQDYTGGSNKPLSLKAISYDKAGNTTTSTVTVTVTPDLPPTIQLTQAPPSGSSIIEGQKALFSATANDDIGLSVSLVVGGVTQQTRFQPPFDFQWTAPQAESLSGPVQILLRANDTKGQTAETAVTTLTVVNDQPPQVAVTSPVQGSNLLEGSTVTLSATASDDVQVAQVEFFLDGNLVATDGAAPFGTQVQVPAGEDGSAIEIKAVAADSIGQKSTATITANRIDDNDAPSVVDIVAPNGGATITLTPSDVVFVIDASQSAAANSGQDVDNDGEMDSLYKVSLFAAKELLSVLTPNAAKVAVIEMRSGFTMKQTLTGDFVLVQNALDNLLTKTPSGSVNFGGSLQAAIEQLGGTFARRASTPLTILFTPGGGSYPTTQANSAAAGGVIVSSIVVGPGSTTVVNQLATATGGQVLQISTPADVADVLADTSAFGLHILGVNVDAEDDVAVASVTITVTSSNGAVNQSIVDTTPPYTAGFALGELTQLTNLTIVATAQDFGGNQSTSDAVQIVGQPQLPQPLLVSLSPLVGTPGDTVTIGGRYFSPTTGNNVVSFNGTIADVTSGNKFGLKVDVPTGGTSGPVTVTAEGVVSNAILFDYDTDDDGLIDELEITFGTNVNDPDTDDDGLKDGAEVNTYGSNPVAFDTDADGLGDGWEVLWGFNPIVGGDGVADPDNDTLTNIGEQGALTDPFDADSDNDTLSDGAEILLHGTSPHLVDTDEDGLTDPFEVLYGFDPTTPGEETQDPDLDTLTNLSEQTLGTHPKNADTDGDGLNDGSEVNTFTTNPKLADTDSDGLSDGVEVNSLGTDPKKTDTDGDGLGDGLEVNTYLTNPLSNDTDTDGLADGSEVSIYLTGPTLADTDLDGLLDGTEVNTWGTSPLVVDSDGDGFSDGDEVNTYGSDPNVPDVCKVADNDVLIDFPGPYCCLETEYDQDFVYGTTVGYSFAGTSTTTKWQVRTSGKFHDGPGALYYGNTATNNFNSGITSGTATSPTLHVPMRDDVTLTFWLNMLTDSGGTTDLLTVAVKQGNTTSTVWTKANYTTFGQWKKQTIDLSFYQGQMIQLVWSFDSVTGTNNTGEGVYVDDITLSAPCPPPPCSEETECDDGDACTTDTCNGEAGCSHTPVTCNDNNGCTDDSCNPASGCVFVNNTKPCTDNNACTVGDMCISGICLALPMPPCNDNNVCTTDSCNPATGCVFVNNTEPCTDGSACTQNDTCTAGSCVGEAITCNDGSFCTNDTCAPATGCVFTAISCSDGNACNGLETCDPQSGCAAGVAPNCNDSNACTTDSCNPATGCVFTAVNCNDGNACTADTCAPAVGCVNTAINCNDNNACTTDSCNTATGCSNTAINCNDNNVCTTDSCAPALGCVNVAINCNDNNVCTNDSCDPVIGCVFVNNTATCTDNNACTQNDGCLNGTCAGTSVNCNDNNVCTNDSCHPVSGCINTPISCNDNNACTADACDPITGCSNTPINCNDSNACTTDSCSPLVGCINTAVDCNDSNACTTDSCSPASGCINNAIVCTDNNACTTDSCDPQSGCTSTPLNCDDGNACTADSCNPQTGCINGPINCDDNNPCTNDSCNPATGCVYVNNTVTCDDNNACTSGDVCGNGICVPGTPIVCNDNNGCTDNTCEPTSGCVFIPNTKPCNDSNACTSGDNCNNGACIGAPIVCNDNNGCTNDSCNPASGCVFGPNTAACNDGNACTNGDVCANSVCVGVPIVCNDNNGCTDDTCNPATGCIFAANTAACNDGQQCTSPDVCANGACVGQPLNCSDGDPCTLDSCIEGIGCVHDLMDCNDQDSCTDDACDAGVCTHLPKLTPETQPVFYDEPFSTGSNGGFAFGFSNPSSKWQIYSGGKFTSSPAALYYGNPAQGNFDNGNSNGVATTPSVSLPDSNGTVLRFNVYMDTEESDNFDILAVFVVNSSGTHLIWSKSAYTSGGPMKAWRSQTVNLDSFKGQSVQFKFQFATNDAFDNTGEGVYIDDIKVEVPCLTIDTDNDGLADVWEMFYGTGITNPDTDGDLLLDGWEVDYGFDPTTPGEGLVDSDNDLLVNVDEQTWGTHPLDADSDDDGLEDGLEVFISLTNPLDADTDGDGLTDGDETDAYGTDPNDVDTDNGGRTDGQEVLQDGTDPLDPDDDASCGDSICQTTESCTSCPADCGSCESCVDPVCAGDPSRTLFAGTQTTSACSVFDGDPASCETAFHEGSKGIASCYYDSANDKCLGCGPFHANNGDCINTCQVDGPVCAGNPSRTFYTGGPYWAACHLFDGDEAGCATAFHHGQAGGVWSCYYDSGVCNGCGYENALAGLCTNECAVTPLCEDPQRTTFAGTSGEASCAAFNGNLAGCQAAYVTENFPADPKGKPVTLSCWYNSGTGSCKSCTPTSEAAGQCANSCGLVCLP